MTIALLSNNAAHRDALHARLTPAGYPIVPLALAGPVDFPRLRRRLETLQPDSVLIIIPTESDMTLFWDVVRHLQGPPTPVLPVLVCLEESLLLPSMERSFQDIDAQVLLLPCEDSTLVQAVSSLVHTTRIPHPTEPVSE